MNKNEIKEKVSISDCLNLYGVIKSKYKDLYFCPFHNDKKPSMIANSRRGVATCLSQKCVEGADIFALIMKFESCNFNEAVRKASSLIGQYIEPSINDKYQESSSNKEKKSADEIPETFPFEEKHIDFMRKRFGRNWRWVAQKFDVRAWLYHIAVPITKELTVFIPLNKQTKENPNGDRVFYRGKNRVPQVFPNWNEHSSFKNILVVEGEKDVMRTALEFHLNKVKDWAVITNTMGANNMKNILPIFQNFNPSIVEKVLICFDHDEAGRNANQNTFDNAKRFFTEQTKISIIQFSNATPKGYDVTDFLNAGHSIKKIITQ